ncbi:YdaU family protein [Roseateles toxinivorans]|uniref:Uncharacterized protein YdaU (DUF1376 family) n=1 Tax=Roseateles toxinivorans TaxID=270368 RepID=A0A4R6QI58_9BURK|nr:YdaU family protein [Roseateles toxinivorans]TDP63160.1 uncharacterized protein YdaU (DUF1376 family) [Roseateles toxinivorans]
MNYFELHIGDLTEATAHLTMLEDGAYGRLLRKYYATEKPLPADIKTVQRLVGARSDEERVAVEIVLDEFFTLQSDGWHQERCDAEIAVFHEKQQGREDKREGAKERQRRARERRASLFETLRGHGVVPPWSTTTAELETQLSRVTGGDASQGVTQPVTRDDTATQTPDTRLQTPVGVGDPAGQDASPSQSRSKGRKPKATEVTLPEWLAAVEANGEKQIPAGDPVFDYAHTIGLPEDFLLIAWRAFKARYTAPPVGGKKLSMYVDWRAAFRNAVRENWLKLWYLDGQQYALTTAGQQAQRAHQESGK